MSEKAVLKRIRELEKLLRAEKRKLKKIRVRRIRIPKGELRKFVKQQKTTRAIARHFKISPRTITRRIREYGLKGIRRRGRKPLIKKPIKFPKPVREWQTVEGYINSLNRIYRFVNIEYPPYQFINPKTLVCSKEKANPKGKFTTIGIYYIALESAVYFLFPISIRYREKPVSFKKIYSWAKENAYDMVVELTRGKDIFVEKVVALTFETPQGKPKKMEGS